MTLTHVGLTAQGYNLWWMRREHIEHIRNMIVWSLRSKSWCTEDEYCK